MGNSYSIYRFSYHIFCGGIILPISCQKNIIQHAYWGENISSLKLICWDETDGLDDALSLLS